MKIIARLILMAGAVGLGLAAGLLLRARQTAGESAGSSSPESAQGQSSAASKAGSPVQVADDSPLATKLEHDLSMSSGVTQWLYWLEALEKARPADFPRLARLAQKTPAALRLVSARWVAVAPRHLFDTLRAAGKGGAFPLDEETRRELAHRLFTEWPKQDPEAAIAALNEPDEMGGQNNWRTIMVDTVLSQDVERGLRLMAEWHVENYSPSQKPIAKWADADPRHAAEFTMQNAVGYGASTALETIGKEWAKSDPAGAMQFASASHGTTGLTLGAAALKAWSEQNLEAAAEWLSGADSQTRTRFSSAFVESWAKKDASGALAWCESNLEGTSLAQSVAGLVKGAASKDVMGAAALVSGMDPSTARADGAVAVARVWFPRLSEEKTTPPEALAWLSGLDALSVNRVLEQVQWEWATSDPKSMAAFLLSASKADIPERAYSILARQMARQNPAEALDWVAQLPKENVVGAGRTAFTEWHASQPAAAMKWLSALPSDDSRRQQYFEAAIQELAYHPQAAEELAAMSGPERAAARSVIEGLSLPDAVRSNLKAALGSK